MEWPARPRTAGGAATAALALVILAVCACGQTDNGQLAKLVLDNGPPGYAPQVVGDNGTLSLDEAAAATPADTSQLQPYLQSNGWRGSYARVWVSGSKYAEDLGFTFSDAAGAKGLVDLEVGALRAGQGNYVYAIPGVPGAQGFILYSQTRVGGRNVFCNGSWFAYQTYAFEVLTCGATPGDDAQASQMTAAQYRAAGGAPSS